MKFTTHIAKIIFMLIILISPQSDYNLKKNDCCLGDEDGKICYPVKFWKWCWCKCI